MKIPKYVDECAVTNFKLPIAKRRAALKRYLAGLDAMGITEDSLVGQVFRCDKLSFEECKMSVLLDLRGECSLTFLIASVPWVVAKEGESMWECYTRRKEEHKGQRYVKKWIKVCFTGVEDLDCRLFACDCKFRDFVGSEFWRRGRKKFCRIRLTSGSNDDVQVCFSFKDITFKQMNKGGWRPDAKRTIEAGMGVD